MGVLIDGKWSDGELPQETTETGQFKRVDSSFRDRITADGSSGFKAEHARYHLYVAHVIVMLCGVELGSVRRGLHRWRRRRPCSRCPGGFPGNAP